MFWDVKKPEIKETKGNLLFQLLKVATGGPFSELKIHDFIKTSQPFPCVILCPRPFSHLFENLELPGKNESNKNPKF